MKNQWPFWLFVIVIIGVVIISMNYRGKDDVVSLDDVFPEQQGAFDYEYHSDDSQTVQSQAVAEDAEKVEEAVAQEAVQPEPVKVVEKVTQKVEPEMAEPKELKSVKGTYTIQILSSKDKVATEKALERVKKQDIDQAYIQQKDLGDKGVWYRIYVGQFTTMNQAQQILPKVKEKYSGAFITKL